MTLKLIERYDTGGGFQVQIDAGQDGSIVLLTTEASAALLRLAEDGSETNLVQAFSYGNFSSGIVETLSDGRYLLAVGGADGFGTGARAQIFNRDGSEASPLINPEFDDASRAGAGFTVAPTQNGGFAFTWNDIQSGGVQYTATHTGSGPANYSGGSDVRIRFFDSAAEALTASIIADEDLETISGATVSRRAADQYVNDSATLTGGQTVWAYLDNRVVGSPDGVGSHSEWEISVQISTAGNVGEPIKVDLGPYNEQFGPGYPQAVDPAAGPNVVALPGGGFAVIWTENLYEPADVWGGYSQIGWETKIRYFDAAGTALTDPVVILTRDMSQGNITKYVWAEALPDGRIVFAYNDGFYGANGNGTTDAFIGIVGVLGSSVEASRVNAAAAENTQFYNIQDIAVRSDGTIDLVYLDASQVDGQNRNVTVIDRFGFTDPAESAQAVANDDVIGTFENVVATGNVFDDNGNGADVDDNGLEVAAVNGVAADVGQPIVLGSGALLTLNADGTFSYDPNDAFDELAEFGSSVSNTTGFDSFTYTLSNGGTATVTVTVRGVYSAPHLMLGTDGDDSIDGTVQDDIFDPGAGADQMFGNGGNDVFTVDDPGDQVFAGNGLDQVRSSISYEMDLRVEELILTGALAIDALGNRQGNLIVGNDAANRIDGRGGDDIALGGAGDDIYIIRDGGDQAVERGLEGFDTVLSTISFELGRSIELLQLVGTGTLTGIGCSENNIIIGNAWGNILIGKSGNDALDGGDGGDQLFGSDGNDSLNGGNGKDNFYFDSRLIAQNVDQILDFDPVNDSILLSRSRFTSIDQGELDAAAFHTGTAATTADHRIIYDPATGSLFYDFNGAGGGGQVLFATVDPGLALTSADFVGY